MIWGRTEAGPFAGVEANTEELRRLIGREALLSDLRRWLRTPTARPLLFLIAPSGSGKSALARVFFAAARRDGHAGVYIDCRRVPPRPGPVRGAIRAAAANAAVAGPGPLIVLDGLEAWREAEDWLREACLPALPARSRVLIAGRNEPGLEWRADSAWQSLFEQRRIDPIPDADIAAWMTRHGMDRAGARAFCDVVRGDPMTVALGLALVRAGGDPCRAAGDAPRGSCEGMLRSFLGMTDDTRRRALEAGALVSELDHRLLVAVVGAAAAERTDSWLRELPFAAPGAHGLVISDRLREILVGVLAREEPDRYRALVRDLTRCLLARAAAIGHGEPLAELIVALRGVPRVRRLVAGVPWRALGMSLATPNDWDTLQDMVQRQSGAQALYWLRYWYRRQPGTLRVARDLHGLPRACALEFDLADLPPSERDGDPVTRRLWRDLDATGRRCGFRVARLWAVGGGADVNAPEVICLVLDWVSRQLSAGAASGGCLVTGGDSAMASWGRWLGMAPVESAEGEPGLQRVCWETGDPVDHYQGLVDAVLTRGLGLHGAGAPDPGHERAVGDALRRWHCDRALAAGALARRLGVAEAHEVRDRLRHCIDALPVVHRRVLHRAYIAPASSQREAAVCLNMGYSTFRRYLTESRRILAAQLWSRMRRAT